MILTEHYEKILTVHIATHVNYPYQLYSIIATLIICIGTPEIFISNIGLPNVVINQSMSERSNIRENRHQKTTKSIADKLQNPTTDITEHNQNQQYAHWGHYHHHRVIPKHHKHTDPDKHINIDHNSKYVDPNHYLKKRNKSGPNPCKDGQTYQSDEFCYDNETLQCYSIQQNGEQDSYNDNDCAPCGYFNDGNSPNASCCLDGQFALEIDNQVMCVNHNDYKCFNSKDKNGNQSQYNPNSGICSHAWKCQQSQFQNDPVCQCHSDQEAMGEFCLNRESNICYTLIKDEKQGISSSTSSQQAIYRKKECGPCGFYGNSGSPNQACCFEGQRAYKVNEKLFCVETDDNNRCLTMRDASKPNQQQSTFKDDICACDSSMNYHYPRNFCPPCKFGQTTHYNANNVYCEDDQGNCLEALTSESAGAQQKITKTPNACRPCGRDNCCPEDQIKVTSTDGTHFCLEKTAKRGENDETMYRCKTYTNKTDQTDYRRGACSPCGYVNQNGQESNCPICADGERVESIRAGSLKICVESGTSICRPIIDYAHPSHTRAKYTPSDSRSECGICGLWDNARCSDHFCYEPGQEKKIVGGETFCVDKSDSRCYTAIGYGVSKQDGYDKGSCGQCGKYPDTECENRCPKGQKQIRTENGSICVVETASSGFQKGECLSLLDENGKQSRHQPSNGTCSLCGKFNIAECPANTCLSNQKIKTVNNTTFCIDNNTNICYNTVGNGIGAQKIHETNPCQQCSKYPDTECRNRCPSGQTEKQTSNDSICVVNSPFDRYEAGDCLTLLNAQGKQSRYSTISGVCSLCGKYDDKDCPSSTCRKDQNTIRIAGEVVCVNKLNQQCTNTIGGGISQQTPYKKGICKQCGLYPDTYCTNRCPDGQTERRLVGGSICVDNSTSECFTLLDAEGLQKNYKPTHGQCALCGKWEIAQCTKKLCLAPQQRLETVNEETFCVDQSTYECTNTLGHGVNKQSIYRKGSCIQCGKYPDTKCQNRCPEGQSERTVNGKAICVVSQFGHNGLSPKACLTLLDSKGQQKQYQPPQGICSLCGKFDDLDCGGCAAGQKEHRDKKTGKRYCITMDGLCFKPQTGDGQRQSPYKEGDCYNCGATACCPSGTPTPTKNPQFCLDKNSCYVLLNSRDTDKKAPYQKSPCGSCGLYPQTLCRTCPVGQTPKHDYSTGTSYCVDESNGQCYSIINSSTNTQIKYNKSDNTEQPCYQCGKILNRCESQCSINQTEQRIKGVLSFCTDHENKCWTLLGDGASKQTPYRGPLCTGCGPYLRSACPQTICLPNQTPQYQSGKLTFCLDDKNNCYQPIGSGESKQLVYKGPECTGCGIKILSQCENLVCHPTQIQKSHDGIIYCIENKNKQCLTPIGIGTERQSRVIGVNDSHPCYPDGTYCDIDSLSLECQNQSASDLDNQSQPD